MAVGPIGFPGNPATSNAGWAPLIREFDGVPMALVPIGCFMMGSTDGDDDELPVHQQCFVEPFWIDVYEVTNAQYGSVGAFYGDLLPREVISWFAATAYCEGRGARLPTEAEWEYAARGPDALIYPWGNEFIADYVTYDLNAIWTTHTTDVGSRPEGVSWVGAYDMGGNVWEWVSSLYMPYPYDATDGREVGAHIDSVSRRVVRGGSYHHPDLSARAANRRWVHPTGAQAYYGMRCARSE